MIDTSAQALITAANGLQIVQSDSQALQIQIYLLQQIAGINLTAQQLIAAANQYQAIPDTATLRQVIVYLLAQTVNEL